MSLEQAVKDFVSNFGADFPVETFALLYAPEKCFLGLVKKDGSIEVKDNVNIFSLEKIYEARVFNAHKELRWLSDGRTKTLTDANLRKEEGFIDTIDQNYLLWGQITNQRNGDWTEFAEARIGAFFVPIKVGGEKKYAWLTAVEYVKEFEDGNAAVFEERLTGIVPYREEKGGKENAEQ
jgi:CRISPR-associated protein (TIGR03984 family)